MEEEETTMTDEKLDTTNVFVKFLPADMNDFGLHNLFSPFGKLISAKVIVDPLTWQSRGFGFVKFSQEEEASLAIKEMMGHKIGNKTLLCKLSNTFSICAPSCNLYIKPLPPAFTEDDLKDIFCEFGDIHTAKIVRDSMKPDDVVGLIRYDSADGALNAIHNAHGSLLIPRWQPLTVRYAESDVQRATRKANISPPRRDRSLSPPNEHFTTNMTQQNSQFTNYGQFTPINIQGTNLGGYENQVPMAVCYGSVWDGCHSPFIIPTLQGYPVYPPLSQQDSPLVPGWYNSYNNVIYPSYVFTN